MSREQAFHETIRVYLSAEDAALLERLAIETGLTKTDVLRRGLRALAQKRFDTQPLRRFLSEAARGDWPKSFTDRPDDVSG
jgi:hypothetical protein